MKNTLFNKVIAALAIQDKHEMLVKNAVKSVREELIAAFTASKMKPLVFREAFIAALENASVGHKRVFNIKYALRVLCDIDSKFRLRAERSDAGSTKVPAWQKHVNAINALTGKERAAALAAIVAGK